MTDTVLSERVNELRFTQTFRVTVETWLLSSRGTCSPNWARRPRTCLGNPCWRTLTGQFLHHSCTMDVPINGKIPVITDSKSGMDVVRNPGVTKHTTHFMRWLHWARELFLGGVIDVILAPTHLMMADDKSKVVDRSKFFNCRAFQLNDEKARAMRYTKKDERDI